MSAESAHRTPIPPGNEAGLAKGATIGRYVVLGLLGRGGMGEVYAAYDPELDRKIAVKLLRARGGVTSPDARTRLLREAQAIARLSHPNVVVVFDVGTFRDSVFMAMEFVEGHTLGYWLEAETRRWREVLEVFMAAGRGLVAAHAAGLVHRDFKPDNVMLTKTGLVRVMDFGLAREDHGRDDPSAGGQPALSAAQVAAALAETGDVDADPDATGKLGPGGQAPPVSAASSGSYLRLKLTRTGAMLGTPAYMAPEQFAGGSGDARADQFAFSVALYEGLYGQRPFAGNNVTAVMANVVAGTVRPAPENTRVPAWIRRILLRGLSVLPEDRFPSMAAVLAALAQDPAVRRRRWLAATAGLAAVGALAAVTHRLSAGQRAMCAGGPARAAVAWGAEQRASVERSFLNSGHKRAGQLFTATAHLLDGYVGRWAAMYGEACQATQVRGEQSADVLDLRMGCLTERLSSLQALTDVLSTADRGVVDNSVSAATALPTLDRCADVTMLRSVIRPPEDPAGRAAVNKMREEVARVNALSSAGRCDQATKVGGPVLEVARGLRYKPLEAEIAFALGRLFDTCLDTKEAAARLEDAVMAAQASRHDELAIEASAMLGFAYADRMHEVRAGGQWVRLAEAILTRFPGHPLLEARVANSRAMVSLREGRVEDALRELRRALGIQESLLGSSSLDVAMSANNVAITLHELGREEEAAQAVRRAIGIFSSTVGEDSGRVALASSNECEILTSLKQFDAAQAAINKALHIWREQNASSFYVGYGLLEQGKLQVADGKGRAAVSTLEESLRLLDGQDPQLTAEAEFSLARGLILASPAGRKRAIALAQSAHRTLSREPTTKRLVREIEAWQREHAGASSDDSGG